jgi:hypothetical protein
LANKEKSKAFTTRFCLFYSTQGPMTHLGSTGAATPRESRNELPVKNTFVELAEKIHVERRSSTVPPSLRLARPEPAIWQILGAAESLMGSAAHIEAVANGLEGDPSTKDRDLQTEGEQCTGDCGPSLYPSENTEISISGESSLEVENPRKPEWSMGAKAHSDGTCKPCAWHWKPSGCNKGENCEFCHLCEEGAVKMRKKERSFRRKTDRKQGRSSGQQVKR